MKIVVFVVCCTLFALPLNTWTVNVGEIIHDYAETIPINRTEPVYVYFPYGNPSLDTDTNNVSLVVNLSSNSLTFVANNIFDLPDPVPGTTVTQCSPSYRGIEHTIDYGMVSGGNLIYGPNTARGSTIPGGQEIGVLNARQTGCLKVGLKVTKTAQSGDTVIVDFAQGVRNGSTIERLVGTIPTRVRLTLANPLPCSSIQEQVGGSCVPKCGEDEYRTIEGVCASSQPQCIAGQEVYNSRCVSACAEGAIRDQFGDCRQPRGVYTQIASIVATAVILVFFGFLIFLLLDSVRTMIRRKKQY